MWRINKMLPATYKKLKLAKLKESKTKVRVKISNNFIESAIRKNSVNVLKTIYYISSKVQNTQEFMELNGDNEGLLRLEVDSKDFLKTTNIKAIDIKRSLEKIQETSISFINEEEQFVEGISLLPYFKYLYGKNKIHIHIYKKIAALIVEVQKNYSFVNIALLMNVSSKHTLKLLPLLMRITQYSKNVEKKKIMSLEELNDFFGTNYTGISKVIKNILIPVKEELKEMDSELSFEYDEVYEQLGLGRPKLTGVVIYPTIKGKIIKDNNPTPPKTENYDFSVSKTPLPLNYQEFKEFIQEAFSGYKLAIDDKTKKFIYASYENEELYLRGEDDKDFAKVPEIRQEELWQKLYNNKQEILDFVEKQKNSDEIRFLL